MRMFRVAAASQDAAGHPATGMSRVA